MKAWLQTDQKSPLTPLAIRRMAHSHGLSVVHPLQRQRRCSNARSTARYTHSLSNPFQLKFGQMPKSNHICIHQSVKT